MKRVTFPTLCMMAALVAAPALAAQADKPSQPRAGKNTECALESHGKQKSSRQDKRHSRPMDCIIVKGYPSQDGRATLRRSLTEEARKELGKAKLPNLKDLLDTGRTS